MSSYGVMRGLHFFRKRIRNMKVLKDFSGAQNRYALRLAGHQSPAPFYAGWDRLGKGVFYRFISLSGASRK